MGTFGRFDEEAESARFWVGTDCRITRICKRARLAIAEPSKVVLITTKGLILAAESGEGWVRDQRFDQKGSARRPTSV